VVDKRVKKSVLLGVEFNVSKALIIIENDKDLDEMFREKFGTDYKMCHASINSSVGLKPKALKYIKDLFEKVIVNRDELLNKYKKVNLKGAKPTPPPTKVLKEGENPNAVQTAFKKKRWGLQAIASDIKEFFGGKTKQIHRTGQKVQELKKMFSRLEMKIFNERFNNKTLNDKQLREISGAIETFNKKVESIVNPKK
jgi:hypothetical protein